MKKFVSIVIALVMVLSMTSAFAVALDCETLTFDWTCAAKEVNCGKATIEVVPYVKVNSACNGWEYQKSDCASAINTENVYFALKLNVPADIDRDWIDVAKLTLEIKGMEEVNGWAVADTHKVTSQLDKAQVDALMAKFADDNEDGWELYFLYDRTGVASWHEVEETGFDIAKVMNVGKVEEYAKAKVCATIESEDDGLGTYVYGDYTIYTTLNEIAIKHNKTGEWAKYAVVDGVIDSITKTSNEFLAEANAFLNLGCAYDVCVNADNLEAIFGWYDKVQDCFAWSGEGASVVNPECSVEIPKTGDVSVVAYAVMAIVAAAGTMLKK